MAQYAGRALIEIAQPLSFFGVLENPVNCREIIVTDSAAWPFDIPVQTGCVLGILQMVAGVAWRIEVIEDQIGVIARVWACADLW